MYHAIVVDDEKWVVKSLIATIRNQEYFQIVAELYDGLSGLEYIRAHHPDLAFVDVRLPGMGGLDILQAAHAEGLNTLFIMISGHAEFAYAQKAMFHNAIGYCLKPFSPSELMDSMQKAYLLLNQRQALTSQSKETDTALEADGQFRPKHLTSGHKSVQMMIDYTEAHYQQDISIQNLADHCSINANYASQIFRQEMGITFISYLTSLRMDHAAWLLTHTSQTVFTIAAQVGYSDYFYFAKVFKKAMGCTPTAFRKSTPPRAGQRLLRAALPLEMVKCPPCRPRRKKNSERISKQKLCRTNQQKENQSSLLPSPWDYLFLAPPAAAPKKPPESRTGNVFPSPCRRSLMRSIWTSAWDTGISTVWPKPSSRMI